LTVNSMPTYTFTANSPAVSMAPGGKAVVTLNLTPSNYAGTVSLAASSSSANTSVALSSSQVSLAGGTAQLTLTISAGANAANHAPAAPWKSGGTMMLCAVLLGAPLTLGRRRTLAVLLTALAISLTGYVVSCGGGGKASISSSPSVTSSRSYNVTVTPTGAGTVVNPAPLTVSVTVQ
jgi:hypothetical protein